MPRFSWRHPLRSIARLITGRPERKPPPAPPPPKPPPGGAPPIGGPYDFDAARFRIWYEVTYDYDRAMALEWWDLFLDTGAAFGETYTRINDLWNGFLRAFYLHSADDGSVPRAEWYDDADVDPSLIDWDHWREIVDTP